MAFQPTRITRDGKEARTFARSMQFCAENVGVLSDNKTRPEGALCAMKNEPGRAITLAEAASDAIGLGVYLAGDGQKSTTGKILEAVKNGAGGRTRTGTGFRPKHFKCHMSTIPSRPHKADVALS